MNPLTAEAPVWLYLACVVFIAAVSWSASFIKDRYEIAGSRPVRRWYSTGSWVTLRCDAGEDCLHRWLVTAWSDEAAGVPWLLVSPVDDEDCGTFWGAVTDFGPYAIRRFHPWLWHGWLPVLFTRETLPVTHPRGMS